MIDNLVGNIAAQAHINSKDVRAAVYVLTEHGFQIPEACTNVRNIICKLSTSGDIGATHSFVGALERLSCELRNAGGVVFRLALLERRFGVENMTAAHLLAWHADDVAKHTGD